MTSFPLSELRQLSNIIADSVGKIEDVYAKASLPIPSLDDLFVLTNPAEILGMSQDVSRNSALVINSAAQLTAILRNPSLSLFHDAMEFHLSSCLRVASVFNIAEILRAEPKDVQEIAEICNTDASKLARVLRLLASRHIFKEVSPDIFANNRLSSALDKGKTVPELMKNSLNKFEDTSGLSALIEHTTDETMKSSAFLADALLDAETAFVSGSSGAPLLQAFNTSKTLFPWLESEGNEYRLHRFGVAMAGLNTVDPPKSILDGFRWSSLSAGSIIVDIGGGLGSKSLYIAEANPHLHIVVQDRAPVIEQAKVYWAQNLPSAKVSFQVHDFFQPQPVKYAAIYLLRFIIHDWAEDEAIKILKHLRASACQLTKLILVEQIVPYICENEEERSISGAERTKAPSPLLPIAASDSVVHLFDIQMMTLVNAEERTIGKFDHLCKEAGWQIQQVYHVEGSVCSQIIATPIDC